MTGQNDFRIKKIHAREIIDCRGYPTIEVDVITENNILGRADAPAGRSRGSHEAVELRDGNTRYGGYGVLRATDVANDTIAPLLKGRDVRQQKEIDQLIIDCDGTEDKSKLGGNCIVATSLAVAKAAANSLSVPLYRHVGGMNANVLPVPMFIYIAGGKLAATDFDFQEFNAMPVGAKSFSEAIRMGAEVYHTLGRMLAKKYSKYALNTGDEGSYSPPGISDPYFAFEMIVKSIEELGYQDDFVLAMDAAATHMYHQKEDRYGYLGKSVSRQRLLDAYIDLAKTFSLKSIEDPFHEDDFEGFSEITKSLDIQIVGDDLFASNIGRLMKGIEMRAANTILLKVNQIGTLTEALATSTCATSSGYSVLVSERSGQTEDTWLADLSVAINSGQIKNGAPSRGERIAQFNQLLRIEEELGASAQYAGRNYRHPK